MAWSVRTEGGAQLKELQIRIKEAGDKGMNRKFRKNIREAGRPAVLAVKAAAMEVNVTSAGPSATPRRGRRRARQSSGLRARVSRAVGISQTRKGIRIRVSARKVGEYGITLPRYLDADLTRFKRWRSPIFWSDLSSAPPTRVKQQTGSPFFFVTIRKHRPGFRKAAFDVMNETGRELTR